MHAKENLFCDILFCLQILVTIKAQILPGNGCSNLSVDDSSTCIFGTSYETCDVLTHSVPVTRHHVLSRKSVPNRQPLTRLGSTNFDPEPKSPSKDAVLKTLWMPLLLLKSGLRTNLTHFTLEDF